MLPSNSGRPWLNQQKYEHTWFRNGPTSAVTWPRQQLTASAHVRCSTSFLHHVSGKGWGLGVVVVVVMVMLDIGTKIFMMMMMMMTMMMMMMR
jgi:hypothetical protein